MAFFRVAFPWESVSLSQHSKRKGLSHIILAEYILARTFVSRLNFVVKLVSKFCAFVSEFHEHFAWLSWLVMLVSDTVVLTLLVLDIVVSDRVASAWIGMLRLAACIICVAKLSFFNTTKLLDMWAG